MGGGLTVGGDILAVGSPPLEAAAAKGSNLGFGIGLSNASTGPEAKMSSALGLEDFSLLYFFECLVHSLEHLVLDSFLHLL